MKFEHRGALARRSRFLAAAVALALPLSLAQGQNTTEIVSLNNLGDQADSNSWVSAISADGRFVLFVSRAMNLIDQDGDGVLESDVNANLIDVFVRDRHTDTTELVTVNSAGDQANTGSPFFTGMADMSADGRYVTFSSRATNLVDSNGDGLYDDDANGSAFDIFVRDRATGLTELVSVNSLGEQGNNSSARASISADGRYVVFSSAATNLVDLGGDGTIDLDANGPRADLFLHDRTTGMTELVSVNSLGEQGNGDSALAGEITPDGRYVAFRSGATNLIDLDGDGILDPDANGIGADLFVRDRTTGITEIVSLNSAGEQGSALQGFFGSGIGISDDGRFVTFASASINLVDIDGDGSMDMDANSIDFDVFVRDRATGVTEIVSVNSLGEQGNDSSVDPCLSADGQLVVFASFGSNLVDIDGDGVIDTDINGSSNRDVFLRDRSTGITEIVSVNSAGRQGNNDVALSAGSIAATISPDGRFVAFTSLDNNFVDSDGDGIFDDDQTPFLSDVFVRGPSVGPPPPANVPPLADAGGPYAVDEGASLVLDASASSDPDGDPLAFEWDLDYDGVAFDVDAIGTTTSLDAAGLDGPSVRTVAVRVSDDQGGSDIAEATVTVHNVAPIVGDIMAPLDPQQIGTPITACAPFADGGETDTYTATWDWGDGTTTAGTVFPGPGGGTVEDPHVYTQSGAYTIGLTVTDDDGASGASTFSFVVVFDPDDGFVTGGGWIDSPPGACSSSPGTVGRANFGFVCKYKKGLAIPSGQTEFQLSVGDLNFHSSTYEWMVVSGAHAKLRGTGTVNHSGNYGFQITVLDGRLAGGVPDGFRIKIWDRNAGDQVVYDNQPGEPDASHATTELGGGQIVIHR